MLFTSFEFVAFLACVLVLYYLIPVRFQWILLLVANVFFYTHSGLYGLLFMGVTIVTSYAAARIMSAVQYHMDDTVKAHKEVWSKQERKAYKQQIKRKKRMIFIGCLLVNLGILAVLKYTNFAIANVNGIAALFTGRYPLARVNLVLPLGISFYTFQTMGYVIDVYRGKAEAEKNIFKMALFNPLLIAILCVMGMLQLMQVDYKTYNAGGQYISYLLTPATVCLAVPLYRQLTLLRKNLKAVVIGIVSGVLASMVSVLIFAKLFGLSHSEYVTLLPKSITTAIGMGVSEELGGLVTITVAVIIITGVLGNVIAEAVLKVAKIEEPIAKGLALGTSAHAIGTSKAMELGPVEGAMSSLAIAVAGLLTVIAASVFAGFM